MIECDTICKMRQTIINLDFKNVTWDDIFSGLKWTAFDRSLSEQWQRKLIMTIINGTITENFIGNPWLPVFLLDMIIQARSLLYFVIAYRSSKQIKIKVLEVVKLCILSRTTFLIDLDGTKTFNLVDVVKLLYVK